MSKKKKFKALLLDERDVLRAVVELEDESQLTERHVDLRPHGGDCDRKPGEYRWNRAEKRLDPLPRSQRAKAGKPSLEEALAFDYLVRWKQDPLSVAEVALAWLDEAILSFDLKGYVETPSPHPLIVEYAQSRGIALPGGALPRKDA